MLHPTSALNIGKGLTLTLELLSAAIRIILTQTYPPRIKSHGFRMPLRGHS